MEKQHKFEVRFWRAGAQKPSGSRMFDTKDQARQYISQYTPKEKKDLEEEWEVGESAVLQLEEVQINDRGMVAERNKVEKMHVQEQDVI
ncbi:MAG: hypothetical protein ACLFUB_17520 [Cyclobacteriaceae bacterium]